MPSSLRRSAIVLFAAFGAVAGLRLRAAPPPEADVASSIRGFSPRTAAAEREVEARFRAIPSADEARRWHRAFTSVPHPATSKANHDVALKIAETWKVQGLEDVVIRQYDVLSSNPRKVQVEMTAPTRYAPTLREDPLPEDPDTSHPDVSGAWLSFSASGDVTAPVVYANSGNPADYDRLRQAGIDPRGKIVVVRYSNPYSYRGFKALTAEREGAAAMIVYSDPAEDGYKKGKVFPLGPWGPDSHVQRGGIAYDYIVPGDPLTPGWASVPGAPRLRVEEAVSVPKVIAVAMSHRDIKPILEAMGGPPAPKEWQGALPLEYRLGGAATLHVAVDMQTDVQPNYVVEGRIAGRTDPDEWIVLGNHHDAWVFGGVDPSSGTASMMELTRAFGRLRQEGVRPRRTLVFCSWDGEEVTLTGSTEWGEQLADELRRKMVAYLNVDSSVSGPHLDVSAVGSLAPAIVELTKELRDPSGVPLYEAWRRPEDESRGPKNGALPDQALVTTKIGSGSDHTVFINFLARPVVELSFTGPYGVYHSVYDDHLWMSRFGDPGFKYHALMAELWGALALRLANADVLPFDFDAYAAALRDFVRKLRDVPGLADHVDDAELVAATRKMRAAARVLGRRVESALAAGTLDAPAAARLDRAFLEFEANWARPEGIPGRPWFKHLLYAPRYTYAAMTLPGITEAAEAGDWSRAREQAGLVVAAIAKNTALLEAAAREVESFAAPADSLLGQLEAIRAGFDGRMAVYAKNLATGETTALDPDAPYETFSVIKVPLMAAVHQRANEGKLSLDDRVTLRADQRRLPSGVLYALDPGLRPTVRDLVTLMIVISDNEATDALGDLVGREAVTRFMAGLGLPNTVLRFSDLEWDRLWLSSLDPSYAGATGDRTIGFPFETHDDGRVGEAFRRVIEDTGLFFGRSTAREMGLLFERMARGELVSPKASAEMIDVLKKQQVNDRIPRYLGQGVVAAHKTGDGQPWVGNDAGIVWVNGQPIVLVVFTGHHRGSTAELHDAVARVAARVVHHYGGAVDPAGLR
jgi:N-acetylated-alpha-linked acidic dipeptidase